MAKVQPVRLAYNIYEPVSGVDPSLSPILFLHGLTSTKERWGEIPQVVATALKRKAYAIDARNHGDSEWNDYFNLDVNVVDLIHFMDTVGISKAILVGHSMGGITAIKTALKRPDLVENIVVEDMVVRNISKEIINVILAKLALLRKSIELTPPDLDEDEAKSHILNHFITNVPPTLLEVKKREEDLEELKRFLNLRRRADGKYQFKANLEAIENGLRNVETLSEEAEGYFEGPACFIYGTLSYYLVGADEYHIKKYFPKAILVGIEDATHNVHTDKPLEFTDTLIKFLL